MIAVWEEYKLRVSLTTFVVHLLTRGHNIANHCSLVQWFAFPAIIFKIFSNEFPSHSFYTTFMLPSSRFPHLTNIINYIYYQIHSYIIFYIMCQTDHPYCILRMSGNRLQAQRLAFMPVKFRPFYRSLRKDSERPRIRL